MSMVGLINTGSTVISADSLAYDYGQIDEEKRDAVIDTVLGIKDSYQAADSAMREATANAMMTGQQLVDLKSATKHGQFEAIVEAEFPFTRRHASRMMNAYTKFFDKSDTVSLFNPSVLGLLAAPSTPDSAIEEATQEARSNGKSPTMERTSAIIAEHKGATRCSVCNKPLTNQQHIRDGVGPVCAKHMANGSDGPDEASETETDNRVWWSMKDEPGYNGVNPDGDTIGQITMQLNISVDLFKWIFENVDTVPPELVDEFTDTFESIYIEVTA